MKILIVDDDAQIRTMLQRLFERNGCQVRAADRGRIALEILKEFPADVVFCDIVMPDGGIGTIQQIAQRHRSVIIAMSGNPAAGQYLATASKFGAHVTLKKPFSLDRLLALVKGLPGVGADRTFGPPTGVPGPARP